MNLKNICQRFPDVDWPDIAAALPNDALVHHYLVWCGSCASGVLDDFIEEAVKLTGTKRVGKHLLKILELGRKPRYGQYLLYAEDVFELMIATGQQKLHACLLALEEVQHVRRLEAKTKAE